MRLLIVEDEKDLANVMKKGLQEQSFTVEAAYDGNEGLYMAENYEFDAIILDIMLPGMDGLTLLKKLRTSGRTVPVILLTARGDVEDRIAGLNIGADDYLPKPFEFSELLARLRAVIRRNKGHSASLLALGDLEVDVNAHEVTRDGREIHLSAKEYMILEYFLLNIGRIISRSELIAHVYGTDFDLDSNVIDVYINYVRNKVDKGFTKKLIHTVRGSGYIMKQG
ncbi:MAG: response regulator transcription factor [Nitrospira sp.]|nr:response regulator transcription factor [bacterium]MBL7049135.1 response regulator transcription factor [Nitrospira sp.]